MGLVSFFTSHDPQHDIAMGQRATHPILCMTMGEWLYQIELHVRAWPKRVIVVTSCCKDAYLLARHVIISVILLPFHFIFSQREEIASWELVQ